MLSDIESGERALDAQAIKKALAMRLPWIRLPTLMIGVAIVAVAVGAVSWSMKNPRHAELLKRAKHHSNGARFLLAMAKKRPKNAKVLELHLSSGGFQCQSFR
jgi:hypothetical protein